MELLTCLFNITQYSTPSKSEPYDITVSPDGNLWFTEAYANKLGRITPQGNITEYNVPGKGNDLAGITKGADNMIWIAPRNEDIVRFDVDGASQTAATNSIVSNGGKSKQLAKTGNRKQTFTEINERF